MQHVRPGDQRFLQDELDPLGALVWPCECALVHHFHIEEGREGRAGRKQHRQRHFRRDDGLVVWRRRVEIEIGGPDALDFDLRSDTQGGGHAEARLGWRVEVCDRRLRSSACRRRIGHQGRWGRSTSSTRRVTATPLRQRTVPEGARTARRRTPTRPPGPWRDDRAWRMRTSAHRRRGHM